MKKNGKPDVLKISKIEKPKIKDNEVLIKNHYVGINYAELLSRRGTYSWAPKKPYVLGMESSGEVVELGSKVKDLSIGDLVATADQHGSYAEYRAIRAYQVFKLPSNLNLKEGAAFIATYATAWIALHEMARVRKGEKILIHSAAGGVGLACVELAKIHGLKVYGTASTSSKHKFLESKGCTPLEYSNFEAAFKNDTGPDCVIETVGGEIYKRSFKCLAPLGRIILVGATGIHINKKNPISLIKAWRAMPKTDIRKVLRFTKGFMGLHIGYLLQHHENIRELLQPLLDMVESNNLKPEIREDQIFPFSEASRAHQFIHDRKNIGKVLLDVTN